MDIKHKNEDLRKLCLVRAHAQKKLGADCAKKIRSRYSDLEAAQSVTDLVAGDPHPLEGDRAGEFSLSLAGGKRLTFVPDHDLIPKTADDAIDWSKVNRIQIVYIGDYHD